jgi:restriction system protein
MARNSSVYEVRVTHPGLNKFRVIRGSDKGVVEAKAQFLIKAWDEEWARKQERQNRSIIRERAKLDKDLAKQKALEMLYQTQTTADQLGRDAVQLISDLKSILVKGVEQQGAFEWGKLIDRREFPEPKPFYQPPTPPPEPQEEDFLKNLTFKDKLLPFIRKKREAGLRAQFESEHERWKVAVESLERELAEFNSVLATWESCRADFLAAQVRSNDLIREFEKDYKEGKLERVEDYVGLVLDDLKFPEVFEIEFDVQYGEENKLLIVNFNLPSLDDMPEVKDYKFVKTRGAIEPISLSERDRSSIYDEAIYQTVLRVLHAIFISDTINALETVVANGFVSSLNKATGHSETACIVSLQTTKAELLAINLAAVDPKACFRSLKGVGSTKFHIVTPVAPILNIDRNDRRFVDAIEVTDSLDESTNLAMISWEDFEHLIREVFEQEFAVNGGERKVTQASRDGGVDAIAFDPDPIRGGKIVIQAKRWSNVVGVSAVRDLYGTVMNEGAIKGILVTTSDYGPDSYEFAKGKPITLMNGANLLSLLEKHGRRAKIDLREARAQRLS